MTNAHYILFHLRLYFKKSSISSSLTSVRQNNNQRDVIINKQKLWFEGKDSEKKKVYF